MLKNPLDFHIGKELKKMRIMTGVTQAELGELIGITSQQINKYESGVNRVHASRLYEIAQILDKPISRFFEGYKNDKNYYNFEFKEEKERIESEQIKNKELINLIKSFSKINDSETRKSIITLLNSIVKHIPN